MIDKDLAKFCLNALKDAGADKAQYNLTQSDKYELNVANGDITLLRTTLNNQLNLMALKDNKKSSIQLNKIDKDSINNSIASLMEMCNAAEEDSSNDIAPMHPSKEFSLGDDKPDLDKMYDLLKKYIDDVKKLYPKVGLEECYFDFTKTIEHFANSNGVDFNISKGLYNFSCMFSSKEGEKTSSFNYSSFALTKLPSDLLKCGSINTLLCQSQDQVNVTPLEGKFLGDVIITPDCLSEMMYLYTRTFLSDASIISGTSLLKDKLEKQVASPKLTIHCNAVGDEIEDKSFITYDGFESQNFTLIDKGILKSFLLSLYGANKTGFSRALNNGDGLIIAPGEKSLDEIIKSTKKGILLARFSGGAPSSNGDFSGVAKNSYYIEDGKIKYSINETMVSGNLYKMFNNIVDISKETVNFGSSILRWISVSDMTISGK